MGSEICEKQLLSLIEKVAKVEINENAIGQYLPQVNAMLESMSKEEVIKHFVSAEFNRFLDYYKNAEDLNASVSSRTDTRASQQSEGGIGFTRFFINMGEMDHINKGTLVRVICERAGINSKDIGRIDIKREFSFIEVSTNVSQNVVSSMEGADIDGRPVNMEISKQTPREFSGRWRSWWLRWWRQRWRSRWLQEKKFRWKWWRI
jgi:ATP-dependent RNA helicase DeaD